MNITNSLAIVSTALKDSTIVQDATKTVTQNAVAAVADVVGKGGFEAKATLGQLIEFQFTGLLVVFTVLGGLTLMCILMAWILRAIAPDQYYGKQKAETTAKPAPLMPPLSASATQHPGLTDEALVAILTVAATKAIGKTVSVVKFRHMGSTDWTWSVRSQVSRLTSPTR